MKYSDNFFQKIQRAFEDKRTVYIEVWYPVSMSDAMCWAYYDKTNIEGSKNTYAWTVRWK